MSAAFTKTAVLGASLRALSQQTRPALKQVARTARPAANAMAGVSANAARGVSNAAADAVSRATAGAANMAAGSTLKFMQRMKPGPNVPKTQAGRALYAASDIPRGFKFQDAPLRNTWNLSTLAGVPGMRAAGTLALGYTGYNVGVPLYAGSMAAYNGPRLAAEHIGQQLGYTPEQTSALTNEMYRQQFNLAKHFLTPPMLRGQETPTQKVERELVSELVRQATQHAAWLAKQRSQNSRKAAMSGVMNVVQHRSPLAAATTEAAERAQQAILPAGPPDYRGLSKQFLAAPSVNDSMIVRSLRELARAAGDETPLPLRGAQLYNANSRGN